MDNYPKYPAYKPSGVEWLGEIPEHWEVKKLKVITGFINRGVTPNYVESSNYKVINQATFSKGYFDWQNIKFTKDRDFSGLNSRRGIVRKNDILLASTGGGVLGKVAFVDFDDNTFQADSHVTIIRGEEPEFMSRYYYYILFISYDLINGVLAQGSTNQTELQREWLINLKLPVPLFSEQTAIANFLDRKTALIDKAIAIKEKQIELLKERRQILIHQAVTGKIILSTTNKIENVTGNKTDDGIWFRSVETRHALSLQPNQQQFQNHHDHKPKMKDSGVEWIGEIPAHWEVKRAKYLFDEINDRSQSGDEELLSVSHMTGVTPRSEKNVYMFQAEDYSGSKLCKENDLIYNIMWAWMGALGVSDRLGIVSPSYAVYRQKDKTIFNSWYLEQLLRDVNYVAHYNRVSTGLHSSRLRFYSTMFFEMAIGYPPIEEQEEIVQYLKTADSKINTAILLKEQEIEKLKEYKASLINEVVTGKIKVIV